MRHSLASAVVLGVVAVTIPALAVPPVASRGGVSPKPRRPVVNLPGVEQTADGGSRLFVSLSGSVPVEERKAAGSITYVLKGVGAPVRNNMNELVTVHFNTPVARARLVPRGGDLHFVVDLRAASTPTWKMVEAADKSSVLQIDFPKGDYVVTAPEPEPSSDADASEAVAENGAPAHERKPTRHRAARSPRPGTPADFAAVRQRLRERNPPTKSLEDERAAIARKAAATQPLRPAIVPPQGGGAHSKWDKMYELQQGVEKHLAEHGGRHPEIGVCATAVKTTRARVIAAFFA